MATTKETILVEVRRSKPLIDKALEEIKENDPRIWKIKWILERVQVSLAFAIQVNDGDEEATAR